MPSRRQLTTDDLRDLNASVRCRRVALEGRGASGSTSTASARIAG